MPPHRRRVSGPSHILAIDLGTSGPKVALVDTAGAVVAADFEPVALRLLPGGGAEQDPDEWWRGITAATRRLLDGATVAPETVVGAAVTGQWSGTVAVDGAGRALAPALIWMDHRGAEAVAERIGGRVPIQGYAAAKLRTWLRLTGGAPARSGKDSLAHILYLQHHRPDLHRAAATFLEPKDYLNLRLSGRAVATFDSIALHWVTDNRRPDAVRYHPELIRLAGLDGDKLPPLVPATAVIGTLLPEAAERLGLHPGVKVIGSTPDVQSAIFGSGAVADFAPHLYLGTSSWLTCHVPFKKTDLRHNMASLPSPLPGRYFVANEQETAGACLDWLAGVLRPDHPSDAELYRSLESEAAMAPAGAGGVLFTPWLYGERTPIEDSTVRASFFNQSLTTTRSDLIRSVYEGVALNSRWLLGKVERFVGRRLEPIVLVGGGARSDFWCRLYADVLDRVVKQAADPVQVNVRGAGLLAATALGYLHPDELAARVPIADTHLPDPAVRSVYDDAFVQFQALYRATRRISARLNRRA